MEATRPNPAEAPAQGVDRLVVAIAKLFHWAGLYGTDHPVLAARAAEVCERLGGHLGTEPGAELLLGVARDRFLYRDRFIGEGNAIVARLAEALYLRQIATVSFDGSATAGAILSLFRRLHEPADGSGGERLEEALARQGVPGVSLLPYNYKELLSRRLSETDKVRAGPDREDELWKLLLAFDLGDREGEQALLREVGEYPEILEAIARRAKNAGETDADQGAGPGSEVLVRLLRRIGQVMRRLPEDRRRRALSALDGAFDGPPAGADGPENPLDVLVARSLTDPFSDDEFLDLLGTVVALEGKSGGRLRRIAETLSADRDIRGSLIPRAAERARESLRAKNYYDLKTWETVEKLLLARSEKAYFEEDYARFLDDIADARGPFAGRVPELPPAQAFLSSLREEETRRQGILVLLELLARAGDGESFADLLEEVRKSIPNVVSRNDVDRLRDVLFDLEALAAGAPPERRAALRAVIEGTDFGQVADIHIKGGGGDAVPAILARFPEAAARPLLDRLLHEPEAPKRRALLRLLPGLGPPAVPAIVERLNHPRWYFVRNLCILIGEIGDRRGAPGLVRAASHADPRVRKEAVIALGKVRAPEAVPALGRILLEEGGLFGGGRDEPVRIDAASSLFRIGGAEAVGLLHRGKESRRAAVREHCAVLLRRLEAGR